MRKLLKRLYLKIKRRFLNHLKILIKCNYKWFGSEYGGFFVCPDLLDNRSVVYSFGIGEDISFDSSIIEKFQCSVFGFDPTPKSIKWINNQHLPKCFHFYEYGIDVVSGIVKFHLPKNPNYVSGSIIAHSNVTTEQTIDVQMKSFQDIVTENCHTKIDILKMDIEGSEYNVLEGILIADVVINQILIEFHDRFFTDGKIKTINAIKLLKSNGFEVFAVSESLEEVSFIRKDSLDL
jgi:FkbM family methyltransferase